LGLPPPPLVTHCVGSFICQKSVVFWPHFGNFNSVVSPPPPPHPSSSCSINLSKIKSRVCHVYRKKRKMPENELHFVFCILCHFSTFSAQTIDVWSKVMVRVIIFDFIHVLFLVKNPFLSSLLAKH
jgi:hypothetical protein